MRRILSVTGSRADYGLMAPVHQALAADPEFDLQLIVTGMHLLPEFANDLAQVHQDKFGRLHLVDMQLGGNSARAMVQSIGHALISVSSVLDQVKPDIVLLQGDRGEMLATAIAAAHMNIAVVHMSGGDFSGSIDDAVRCAITKFAHFHLTNSDASTQRLLAMAERPERIQEVGEPALDRLRALDFIPLSELAGELRLPLGRPFLMATLHPVTEEAHRAGQQMRTLLEAIEETGMTAVFTYPNSDQGGSAMRAELESWRGKSFLRIEPSMGSSRYLSLLRHAAAIVGNSSSALFDAPSLKIPAINVGSRQNNRLAANNVVNVEFEKSAIVRAIGFVLNDSEFRRQLAECKNPYGDGHAVERTMDVLRRLRLGQDLLAKWRSPDGPFLAPATDGV